MAKDDSQSGDRSRVLDEEQAIKSYVAYLKLCKSMDELVQRIQGVTDEKVNHS
ncbi:MAG: hypothetical protein AAFR31_05715 [Cyanobacteria bacterium J06627_8]